MLPGADVVLGVDASAGQGIELVGLMLGCACTQLYSNNSSAAMCTSGQHDSQCWSLELLEFLVKPWRSFFFLQMYWHAGRKFSAMGSARMGTEFCALFVQSAYVLDK